MAKPSKHKQPGVERSDTPGFRKRSGIDPEGIAEPCICCCDPFGIRFFCFASLSGSVAALNPRLRSSDAFGIASKMSKLQPIPSRSEAETASRQAAPKGRAQRGNGSQRRPLASLQDANIFGISHSGGASTPGS